MYTGILAEVSNQETWSQAIEILEAETDDPYDFSDATEITINLREGPNQFTALSLTMGNGDITVPETGVIEWKADFSRMGALFKRQYEAGIIFVFPDGKVQFFLGHVNILEGL